MTADEQQRAQHQHRGSLTLVVDIAAQNGRDEHGQQREHCKDALSRLTHVAHVAVDDE